jgi:alpha-maltose-1-phosphate synthase
MRIAISAISFCEYLIQMANGLAGLGHSVLLIMPKSLTMQTVGMDFECLLAPAVQYYNYDISRRCNLHFYRGLFQAISAFKPGVLHVHDNGEIETLALLLRFKRLPLVVTIHDVTTHPGADSRIALRRRCIKILLRRKSNVIHVHGLTPRKLLEENNPALAAKSMIVPHGTLSLFTQWKDGHVEREPHNCLFFGRMEKYRGLDNLLKIGRLLKEKLHRVRIVVAGRGTELGKYKDEMLALGIFEIHDSFIPDKDVQCFFRRASLLLLPYHEASQSGVISMGLPFGVPVVATNVGSISEIIVDGKHGRIVPVGDVAAFSAAVIDLLNNDDRRDRMSVVCKELGESLSFSRLAKDFTSMYERAISLKSQM